MISLPNCGLVLGTSAAYRLEHIARRPGGALDVVVSATPYRRRAGYQAFRRSECGWRPLAGPAAPDLAEAIRAAEHATRYTGWPDDEMATLLAFVGGVAR